MKKDYIIIAGIVGAIALLFFNRKKLTDMKLSENFNLSEFEKSDTAAKVGINNSIPNSEVVNNIKRLTTNVLQPLRNYMDEPVTITSGYRTPSLNTMLNGATHSQHMRGEAADIVSSDNKKMFDFIKNNLDFDQLISEHGTENNPLWIHVSYKQHGNRNQVLRIEG